MSVKAKVTDKRRLGGTSDGDGIPASELAAVGEGREFLNLPRTELATVPGMSLAGQAALAQASPGAEFAVAPVVSAEAIAAIKKVVEEYKIRPPRGWILIKELPPAEKIGLILVPEICQQPPKFGIVIAVGAGEWQMGHEIPPEVKAGDHVTFASFAGETREILGEKLIQMRTDEIMLIAG